MECSCFTFHKKENIPVLAGEEQLKRMWPTGQSCQLWNRGTRLEHRLNIL